MLNFPKKSKLKLSLHVSSHFFNYFSDYWWSAQISYSARDLKHYNPKLAVTNPKTSSKSVLKASQWITRLRDKIKQGIKLKFIRQSALAGLYTKSPAEQYQPVLSQWSPMGHLTVQLLGQPNKEWNQIYLRRSIRKAMEKSSVINVIKHQKLRWVS